MDSHLHQINQEKRSQNQYLHTPKISKPLDLVLDTFSYRKQMFSQGNYTMNKIQNLKKIKKKLNQSSPTCHNEGNDFFFSFF